MPNCLGTCTCTEVAVASLHSLPCTASLLLGPHTLFPCVLHCPVSSIRRTPSLTLSFIFCSVAAEDAFAVWKDDQLGRFVAKQYKLAVGARANGNVQRAAALLGLAFQ